MLKPAVCLLAFTLGAAAQSTPNTGAQNFEKRCAVCHGGDGTGSDRGPNIRAFLGASSDDNIAGVIRKGQRAMPAFPMDDSELRPLLSFLRTLAAPRAGRGGRGGPPPRQATVKLPDGRALQGTVKIEGSFDMQLQTADGKIHFLSREGEDYREIPVAPKRDWLHYDGSFTANRFSPLDQISLKNVARLAPKWFYPMPNAPRIEATPVVEDGIMYVTTANEVHALNATNGRQIWQYRQPRTPGLLGEAGGGANRGVALSADKVFIATDHAHLVALEKISGRKIWDVEMGDYRKDHYESTGAPLVAGDLVFAGVAGGEEGARGFLDAYYASTGERAWRFYTIPKPGEKLAETWIGSALVNGCGATWMTGSYDPRLDLLYWTVGNPCPDYNGDDRKGDNLYTNSVLALKPKTGELKWHFQFTPHDTHDWDAEEPPMLVDEVFQGRPRKLLVQANRNAFFYVLDRETGEFLRGTPFTSNQTWAKGLDAKGRPILNPNIDPTLEGVTVCPSAGGATNWMSASFNPATKLVYILAGENCAVYRKIPAPLIEGQRYFNGTASGLPGARRFIRALELATGKVAWDYELLGAGARTSSGTLSTAGGLVFFGEGSGVLAALDAKTGKPAWRFHANQQWRASPMTYMVGGKQYVAIGGPSGFFAFALAE